MLRRHLAGVLQQREVLYLLTVIVRYWNDHENEPN
jgi:hypothetical protein